MNKLIEIKNLNISLGERILYKNLNFTINKGDSYIFFGENGSGKSLLLELIALGNSFDLRSRYKDLNIQGEILNSFGQNLLDPKIENRQIVYVTQEENFYNNSTIISETRTGCIGMNIEFDEGKLDLLLEYFNIKTNKTKKIKNNLSYGEGKLIHLISNILKLDNAKLLLLDEPLNHLSFKNSKLLNKKIKEIKEKNPELTILVVSHCKAINFVEKAIKYNYEKERIEIIEYKSYNCFGK